MEIMDWKLQPITKHNNVREMLLSDVDTSFWITQ